MFAGKFFQMPDKVYDPSLIGWLLLNEGSGNIAFDSSGTNHNGTFVGSPVRKLDTMEHCVEFNGASAISVDSNVSINIHTGTASLWVKTSTTAGSDFIGLLSAATNWAIYVYQNLITMFDWYNLSTRQSYYRIDDNKWHHLALTFVSRAGNGSILYYDGQPVFTTTIGYADFNTYPYYLQPPSALSIGAESSSTRFFTGRIKDVRIYNRVLSAAEVLNLYQEKNRVLDLPKTEMFYGFPRKGFGDFN